MKTTVEKKGRVRLIEERDGETVLDRAMAVVDRVHAEVEEVFDWLVVRWSKKMREKFTVGWEENGGEVRWRAWWSTAYSRLSRSKLNLYSSVHGWWSEREKKSWGKKKKKKSLASAWSRRWGGVIWAVGAAVGVTRFGLAGAWLGGHLCSLSLSLSLSLESRNHLKVKTQV